MRRRGHTANQVRCGHVRNCGKRQLQSMPGGLLPSFAEGQDACQQCLAGSYCLQGSSTPIACPPGRHRTSPGAVSEAECLPCDEGHACSSNSTSPTQLRCGAGSYATSGSASCTDCAAGTHQPVEAQAHCLPCTEGFACAIGSSNMTACSPGSHSPVGRLSRCLLCRAGSYQDEPNAVGCKPCDPGGLTCHSQ